MTVIDEDWLAEALRDLGSAIEVPEDGPQRILAARGPLPSVRHRRMRPSRPGPGSDGSPPPRRRRLVAVGVALGSVAALVVASLLVHHSPQVPKPLAASSPPAANAPSRSLGPLIAGTAGGDGVASGTASQAALPAGSAKSASPNGFSATALAPAAVAPVATKVIKTGTIDLHVKAGQVSPTVDQLTSLAGGLGGYVANATSDEVGTAPTANLTLRVPVDQFETLLTRTRALGTPTVVTTSGQDVTSNYVDLNAQIQALEATRTQYLQILAKATTIGDILSVEQQLSGLQTQLQQLQGQQMVLDDQTSFGTLTVQVSVGSSSHASPDPVPPSGLAKAWGHARSSFAHGVEAVIGASGGILVFLVFAGLVLLAGRLLWPVVRRRLV
jgi:hypothetical protein